MKRILCIFCILMMLLGLCSCKDDSSHKSNEYETMKTSATKDSVEEFVSLLENIEPSGLISGYKFDEETCYNVTPPEVAAETNMKIFKFSDSCASFVMIDNEVYPLCEFFGGYGFVNAIPCDFDNDGNKDLFVASSWGSGLHRSVISVFNSVSKESTILYDTSTSDTPSTDLIVARSSANIFTGEPDIDEKLYYSVLSVKINVENNNFANLAYVVTGVEGNIECKDNTPQFIPYQK